MAMVLPRITSWRDGWPIKFIGSPSRKTSLRLGIWTRACQFIHQNFRSIGPKNVLLTKVLWEKKFSQMEIHWSWILCRHFLFSIIYPHKIFKQYIRVALQLQYYTPPSSPNSPVNMKVLWHRFWSALYLARLSDRVQDRCIERLFGKQKHHR